MGRWRRVSGRVCGGCESGWVIGGRETQGRRRGCSARGHAAHSLHLSPPPPHTHLPIHAARADEALSAAAEAGALAFLRTGALESAPMRDEPDHQRELYASVLNQLLMLLLSSSAGA